MDLYEALKNGTSEEELKKTFEKDLAFARARIKKEDDAETARQTARKKLNEAITEYASSYGIAFDNEYSVADLIKSFDSLLSVLTPIDGDDDIILKFIKTL
mgnify:CR=1 FL=1